MKNETKTTSAKFLGSLGGKASAKKRFEGKSKEEISEIMRRVRFKNRTKEMNKSDSGKDTYNFLKETEQIK